MGELAELLGRARQSLHEAGRSTEHGGLGRPARRPVARHWSRARPDWTRPSALRRKRPTRHQHARHRSTRGSASAQGCATMSTEPSTSRTSASVAESTIVPGVAPDRPRRTGAPGLPQRDHGNLEPALRRPEQPSASEDHHHEDDQAAHDPSVAQRVGAVAEGQEKEPEDRDAVDAPAGPVHPRAGSTGPPPRGRRPGAEQPAQPRGRGRRWPPGWPGRRPRRPHGAISTMSKAGPFGWWCTPDIFTQFARERCPARDHAA